jgi:hypothetical protein
VGGNAGNEYDTLYGRGGARAAGVGEQRLVHELMREHGVQVFFYGHDHVFVDDVVDDIHYALPGSFGAPWRFAPAITGYRRYWPDAGHARLTVTPREARVRVHQPGGAPVPRLHGCAAGFPARTRRPCSLSEATLSRRCPVGCWGWTGSLATCYTITPPGSEKRYGTAGNTFVAMVEALRG